jgi:outer membrane receptor protein involved in Fe transport
MMIKKVIFFLLIFVVTTFSQDDKNPNVELPDFVITGNDVVSVRRVEKMKPGFVGTVTKEFINPVFAPDELELAELSNPLEGDLSLLDSSNYYKGRLTLEAGRYTLPAGELNYAYPFTRGMIHGRIIGDSQSAYVDNSGKVYYEGALDIDYSLSTEENVLPGTKFSLSGKHGVSTYKFFGSDIPERERTLNAGNAYFGINNLYLKQFIFDVNIAGDYTYLNKENFNESILKLNAFGKYQLGNLGVTLKSNYQKQFLTTDYLGKITNDYFFFRPSVSLELFDLIMADLGFTFSGSQGNSLNTVFAAFGLEISENLVLLAEYSPMAEFITTGKFLRENNYFNPQSYSSYAVKKSNATEIVLKYEYNKYFQIDGGFRYFSSKEFPYFINPADTGVFDLAFTDAKSYNWFANLLFHLGPYGIFYGSFDFHQIKNSEGSFIPYHPETKGSLTYGYNFGNGFNGEAKLKYLSGRFTNIRNSRSVKSFFNAALKLEYQFKSQILLSLQVTNLFNTKYYLWEGYQEKPLDLIFGVNFLFN